MGIVVSEERVVFEVGRLVAFCWGGAGWHLLKARLVYCFGDSEICRDGFDDGGLREECRWTISFVLVRLIAEIYIQTFNNE